MKTLILSALLLLTAAVQAGDSTDPKVQKWEEEQAASHARAMVQFSDLIKDPKLGFVQHCDDEIYTAQKNNDPIISKPDWPEKIGQRVVDKFFKREETDAQRQARIYEQYIRPAEEKERREDEAKKQEAERQALLNKQAAFAQQYAKVEELAKRTSQPLSMSGQWYCQGRLHNGSFLKITADKTQIYVISDWDNYGGSWQNVSDLDTGTRVNLNVATPKEKETFLAEKKVRAEEAERSAAALALKQEQIAARRQAEQAAQTEDQKLAVQQEIAALLAEQNELLRRQGQGNINVIYAPGR